MPRPPTPFLKLDPLTQSQIDLLQKALIELKGRAQDQIRNLEEFTRRLTLVQIDDEFGIARLFLSKRTDHVKETDQIAPNRKVREVSGKFLRSERQVGTKFGDLVQLCFAMHGLATTNGIDFLSTETDPSRIADHFFTEAASAAANRRAERKGHAPGH